MQIYFKLKVKRKKQRKKVKKKNDNSSFIVSTHFKNKVINNT